MSNLDILISRHHSTDQVLMELPMSSKNIATVSYGKSWGKASIELWVGSNTLPPNLVKVLLKLYAEGKIDRAEFSHVSDDRMTRHTQIIEGNLLRTIL